MKQFFYINFHIELLMLFYINDNIELFIPNLLKKENIIFDIL